MRSQSSPASQTKPLRPFDAGAIKVLLLENIAQSAVDIFLQQGYQIERHSKALPEDVLIEKIRDVQMVGIRSKTKLTKRVLEEAKRLLVIGCFCIGTNQVDLDAAAHRGIAVFNSPFSNSRSVAELVISEIIALSRQLGDRNNELHQGVWNKLSANCYEIRGKTLGIVGYGHIGRQLSVLAEAMGMKVLFYDIVPIMPMGMAKQVNTLQDLLQQIDFLSLHVPETDETKNMMDDAEITAMKKGSYLINASRGTVVKIPALIKSLKSKHLSGAALDVYPREPAVNGETFNTDMADWTKELLECSNIILTPHIGGSTEEAQHMIGIEVSTSLVNFINYGTSVGAVNFPEVDLRAIQAAQSNYARLLFVHQNVPGVLKEINDILSVHNVDKQHTDSRGDIAYLITDISQIDQQEIRNIYEKISSIKSSVLTRIVY